jgi:hypothetical protein
VLLSALEVATLTKDLDDDHFAVRDAAFKDLQAAGSRIEPELHPYLEAEGTSIEVRERLRSIIANWNAGEPQTVDETRLVRGLEVLARIGLQDADDFLVGLKGEQYDDLIRRNAKRVVEADGGVTEFENPAMRLQQNLFRPKK